MNLLNNILPLSMLCFALILGSCSEKESIQDQFESKLVIHANLEAGTSISGLEARSLTGFNGTESISDLEFVITSGTESVTLTERPGNDGIYDGPEEFFIQAGEEYSMNLVYKDESISSSTACPPLMTALQSSKEYLEVDMQGDLVFLEWAPINTGSFNEYFYVIELIPLDSDAEQISRSSGELPKSKVLSYTSEATLSINDFNYYGEHLIKVSAVNKEYEYLYLPQENYSINGPTNISGAYGYFIATSSVETSLEVR